MREVAERAWSQLLDRQSFAADRSFDAAGGDSLKLLRLIFFIEEGTGINLPMDRVQPGIRPSELLRLLDETIAGDERRNAAPGTVFLMPGAGGDSLVLAALRAGCAGRLSFVTVEYPEWPDLVEPTFDFTSLIRHSFDEIMQRSAPGPLRLAGYSMGGHIAYEVAAALIEAGREVEFLGILDTDAAPLEGRMLGEQGSASLLRNSWWDLNSLWRAAQAGRFLDRAALLAARELTPPGRAWLLRRVARHRHALRPAPFAHYLRHHLNVGLMIRAERVWRQGRKPRPPIAVPTVLFRSEEHDAETPQDLSWRRRSTNVTVVQCGGEHLGMMRPPHLAATCARFIDVLEGSRVAVST
jgi:thioesterase domain-containing protein/acyl carrier protein